MTDEEDAIDAWEYWHQRAEELEVKVKAATEEIERLSRQLHIRNKEVEMVNSMLEAHGNELKRLREAKCAALAIADERSKENVALRALNEAVRVDAARLNETVTVYREDAKHDHELIESLNAEIEKLRGELRAERETVVALRALNEAVREEAARLRAENEELKAALKEGRE